MAAFQTLLGLGDNLPPTTIRAGRLLSMGRGLISSR